MPVETLRFTLSFGLGGMSATLLLVLLVTGLLQLLSYSPQTDAAYLSIQQMYHRGNLAGFIRNCHYWSGNLIIFISFLHLLRVFFTGALTGSRRYNWLVGLCIFLFLLFANFSGYLMPWDQLAYWAVTIFTSMLSYIPLVGDDLMYFLRGGLEVGKSTLSIFYAIHVGILPAILLLLVVYHFWLIRKSGGLIQRTSGNVSTARMAVIPHLITREAATASLLLGLVLLFSALVDAPLAEQANPGQSPNPAKAAWYFMGLQELLLHLHPSFAICVIPPLVLGFLAIVPFYKNAILPAGIWFGGRKGLLVILASFFYALVLTIGWVLIDNMVNLSTGGIQAKWLLFGVLPTLLFIFIVVLHFYLLRLTCRCSVSESVSGAVVLLLGTTITLTVIGIWFRGAGMALTW